MTEGGGFDRLGRGAMLNEDIPGCIRQNHVFRVRVESRFLEPAFLANYLQTQSARSYFLSCAKRTTNLASVNMTQLRALTVATPSLQDQRQFTGQVDAVRALQAMQAESEDGSSATFDAVLNMAFNGQPQRFVRKCKPGVRFD